MTTGTNKVAPQNSKMELTSTKSLAQGRRGSQMLKPANANTFVGKMVKDPKKKGWVKKVDKFLDHWAVQFVLGLALFMTLFLPDLWVIMNPNNDVDLILNIVLVIFFVVFTAEIFLTSFCREDYFNSLFFYMDIVGTVSIIIDLTWVAEIFQGLAGGDPGTLRAARVAKLGAKAGRLAKLAKMFKFLNFGKKEEEDTGDGAKKISAKMGMLLSQRVALLIMTIVIINPFLSPPITDFSATGFLLSMNEIAKSDSFSSEQWRIQIREYKNFYKKQRNSEFTVAEPIWLKIRGISEANCPAMKGSEYDAATGTCMVRFAKRGNYVNPIRSANKRFASSAGHGRYNGEMCSAVVPEFAFTCVKGRLTNVDALFDNTQIAVFESWLSIALICMVIVLLVGFTATFNMAVDDLVVKPISRIMEKLKKSAETVLKSVKQMTPEEEEDEDNALSETDVLEIMVNKLARIVKKSMSNNMQDVLDEHGSGGMDADTTAWLSSDYSSGRRNSDPAEKKGKLTTKEEEIITADLPVEEHVLNSFKFDVLAVETDKTFAVIKYMFDKHQLLSEFGVDRTIFVKFVEKVKEGYKTEPQYHMWHHGCDVMHTVYQIMNATQADKYMNKLEIFSSIVAALAHDIGHPGVNNGFLVKSKDTLAMLHNDKSPLENMHCATLYTILSHEGTNLFHDLSPTQFNDSRKIILTCILNTDMAFHFENLKKLEMFEEVHGTFILDYVAKLADGDSPPVPECLQDAANKLLLQESFLHAADLSNPVKPTKVYEKWVALVTSEFFSQGDKEKGMGMPASPMCDRDSTNIPNMQMGFIDFIIFPFYSTLFKLFPDGLLPLGTHLQENYSHYGRLAIKDNPDKEQTMKEKMEKMNKKIDDIFSP